MIITPYFSLIPVFLLTILSLSSMSASPVNKYPAWEVRKSEWTLMKVLKPTLEQVQSQLTSWRQYFQNKMVKEDNEQRVKRHTLEIEETIKNTTDVTSTEEPKAYFEDYEKQFLINQTMTLLKYMLEYKEYAKSLKKNNTTVTSVSSITPSNVSYSVTPGIIGSSTTDGNRVDAVLERKLRELNRLSVIQLDQVFHNVKNAAQKGSEDISISSLCCPL